MNKERTDEGWQPSIGNAAPQHPETTAPAPNLPSRTSSAAISSASPSGSQWRTKTVLLVDSDWRSRESRAKIMRSLGVNVDSVDSADAARARLAVATYNLILVDPGREVAAAESFVQEIRRNNARQLIGFLVGSPLFVATSLSGKSRPRRAPAPATPAIPSEQGASAVDSDNFGQKVRDAEAKGTA